MAWAPEADARLRQMWDAGAVASEIGRRLGVSKNAVVGRARRIGCTPRPSPLNPGSDFTPEMDAEIRALRDRGYYTQTIAARINRPVAAVRYRIRMLGMEPVAKRRVMTQTLAPVAVARSPVREIAPSVESLFDRGVERQRELCASAYVAPVEIPTYASNTTCQFPLWDDDTPRAERKFCGATSVRFGRSYCDHHHAVCFVPVRPKVAA